MARRVARGWNPRAIVALVLLGFVLVATGVIARRTYGIRQARDLVTLNRKVDALQAERVRLDAEIRDASSLDHLAPILRDRLQMHIPADSMVVNLPRPRPQ